MSMYRKYFFIFLGLASLVYGLVILYPFLVGLGYSFTSWHLSYFESKIFVGLKNYGKIFIIPEFRASLVNTGFLVALCLAIQISLGLLLAILISKLRYFKGFFRSAFFMPNFIGGLVLGYIWQFVFEYLFDTVLFTNPNSFFNTMLLGRWSGLTALAITLSWQSIGYIMVIYLAGINSIPQSLFEAADIDGASSVQNFKHIMLPLLMPSITITLFLTLSGTFKVYDQNLALNDGLYNTRLITLQIYRYALEDTQPNDYGAAQAGGIILFLIIAVISMTQVWFTKKREVEM
ncbi:MAG: sugar ABC transporter permease [Spirochaetales bacterium]|nr:sugar ABC transporter permease [Spirochaetales bacterium]